MAVLQRQGLASSDALAALLIDAGCSSECVPSGTAPACYVFCAQSCDGRLSLAVPWDCA